MLGWWLVQFVGTVVLSLILVAVFYEGTRPDPIPIPLIAGGQFVQWVVYLGAPLLVTSMKGNGPVADLGLAVRAPDVGLGVVAGIALQLLVVPIVYWPILRLTDADPSETAEELVDVVGGAGDWILLTIVVAVMAPLVEELFFRGFLLGALRRIATPAVAVVLSSAAFALVHFLPILFPGTFLLGLVAGAVTIRTGRLAPAIAMHLGFNATTLVVLGAF